MSNKQKLLLHDKSNFWMCVYVLGPKTSMSLNTTASGLTRLIIKLIRITPDLTNVPTKIIHAKTFIIFNIFSVRVVFTIFLLKSFAVDNALFFGMNNCF